MQHRCDDLAYGFGRDERMVEIVQAALFLRRNVLRQAADGIAAGGVLHRKLLAAERSCRQYQQGEEKVSDFPGHSDSFFRPQR